MPFEERSFNPDYLSKKNPVRSVWMISENLPDDELAAIVAHSHYYLYLVSYLGTTGRSVDSLAPLRTVVAKVKALKNIPVVVGFGIRSKSDAAKMLEFADGAIIGTEIINQLNLGIDKACSFLKTLV
jgi:tryptophan synthase alpha chain